SSHGCLTPLMTMRRPGTWDADSSGELVMESESTTSPVWPIERTWADATTAAGTDWHQQNDVPSEHLPVTVIEPRSTWAVIHLRDIWRFRELLCFLAWRDVKIR